jgi:hypothetical protein
VIVGIPAWALLAIAAASFAVGEVFTPGLLFLGAATRRARIAREA